MEDNERLKKEIDHTREESRAVKIEVVTVKREKDSLQREVGELRE